MEYNDPIITLELFFPIIDLELCCSLIALELCCSLNTLESCFPLVTDKLYFSLVFFKLYFSRLVLVLFFNALLRFLCLAIISTILLLLFFIVLQSSLMKTLYRNWSPVHDYQQRCFPWLTSYCPSFLLKRLIKEILFWRPRWFKTFIFIDLIVYASHGNLRRKYTSVPVKILEKTKGLLFFYTQLMPLHRIKATWNGLT